MSRVVRANLAHTRYSDVSRVHQEPVAAFLARAERYAGSATPYDLIVMDTPPSESYLTVSALVAADQVIIPLQAHFLALQGLAQAQGFKAKVGHVRY